MTIEQQGDFGVTVSDIRNGCAERVSFFPAHELNELFYSLMIKLKRKRGQKKNTETIVEISPEIGNPKCLVVTRYQRIDGYIANNMYLATDGKTWKSGNPKKEDVNVLRIQLS